jgi:hypothetical protein
MYQNIRIAVFTQDGKEHVETDAMFEQWCYIDTASENFYMLKTYQIILDRDRMHRLYISCDNVNKYITFTYEVGGLEMIRVCLKDCILNTTYRNDADYLRIVVKHKEALDMFRWCFEKAADNYEENAKEEKKEKKEKKEKEKNYV